MHCMTDIHGDKTAFEGLASRKWNKGRLTNFASAVRSRECELLAWTSKLVMGKLTMTFVCIVRNDSDALTEAV
jgi:hypothetical protein